MVRIPTLDYDELVTGAYALMQAVLGDGEFEDGSPPIPEPEWPLALQVATVMLLLKLTDQLDRPTQAVIT